MFFLLDLAAELDLEAIHAVYRQKDPRGEKAYDPRMMVLVLLYVYCVGLPSSRKIEKACWEDSAFRVLSGNQQPDHSRISDFGRRHLDALAGLLIQVLQLCQKAGLVSLGTVALDGTKVKANARKHKAMSHERMLKSERKLEAEMRALLRKAEIIDAQEDGRFGKGKRGDELPEELQRRSSRLEWIRQAKAELEAEAAASKARQLEEQAEAAEQEAKAAEPVAMNSAASGRHAAAVARASGLMSPTGWRLRKLRPQPWSWPPVLSVPPLPRLILWRCRSARYPPMQPATPNPRHSETLRIPIARSSRPLTVGCRATTPRSPSMATTR